MNYLRTFSHLDSFYRMRESTNAVLVALCEDLWCGQEKEIVSFLVLIFQ